MSAATLAGREPIGPLPPPFGASGPDRLALRQVTVRIKVVTLPRSCADRDTLGAVTQLGAEPVAPLAR
jgi:hypothetical protein